MRAAMKAVGWRSEGTALRYLGTDKERVFKLVSGIRLVAEEKSGGKDGGGLEKSQSRQHVLHTTIESSANQGKPARRAKPLKTKERS